MTQYNTQLKYVIQFCNSNEEFATKELINYVCDVHISWRPTINVYRRYLTCAGYIKQIRRGRYQLQESIPITLMLDKLLKKAYPARYFTYKKQLLIEKITKI